VAPTNVSMTAGVGTQSFTATVLNDSVPHGVTWAFGTNCSGAACGTISSNSSPSGSAIVYTPPSAVTTTQSITLTATSVTDGTKSASAQILVNPAAGGGGGTAHFDGRAFPEAQGGGAVSVGGRGGTVIAVTNLQDSGTGSLRACVQASGARTCIFKVAGLIPITSGDIQCGGDNITIAGQTAPGQIILGGPN